ncbi:MAG: rRNA maturation RNase YbeY [Chloroflexi bacterium]|nr:rRNA maturation RNase YbeY [Chloroflexota bacterium]
MPVEIRTHKKFSSLVERARVMRIARKTLRAEKRSASFTVYVTTDAEIRKLNRQFHATDAPTDVLSFPTGIDNYIGDIVVSYERAKVQAREAGWRIADEIDLLVVHGILHLLGYDDLTPRKRAKMWKRQEEILGRVIRDA